MREYRILKRGKNEYKVQRKRGFWIFSWWSSKDFSYVKWIGHGPSLIALHIPTNFNSLKAAEEAIENNWKEYEYCRKEVRRFEYD